MTGPIQLNTNLTEGEADKFVFHLKSYLSVFIGCCNIRDKHVGGEIGLCHHTTVQYEQLSRKFSTKIFTQKFHVTFSINHNKYNQQYFKLISLDILQTL